MRVEAFFHLGFLRSAARLLFCQEKSKSTGSFKAITPLPFTIYKLLIIKAQNEILLFFLERQTAQKRAARLTAPPIVVKQIFVFNGAE